jgi:lipoate-protein ligase A
MIEACRYILTDCVDPYQNLALEEYLLETVRPGEVILYLWQNQQTVVIGRNQNAWKEVRVPELEKDGGHLVRRLSGGGAVFHDLGNLNFTFLINQADYDVARQTEVILQAARLFGIPAERTGRNDITADGRKFSGNAFYKSGENAYHHGTVLVDVDMTRLSRYLNVPAQKLESKGVSSVKARVVNLREFRPDLTIPALRDALVEAFGKVYGLAPEELPASRLDESRVAAGREKFASWEWIYGRPIPFSWEGEARFPWGGIELQLSVTEGRVDKCAAYSDALEGEIIEKLPALLIGCPFHGAALAAAIASLKGQSETIYNDLSDFLRSQNF